MGKRYTQKEFEDALHKLYPNVIITGEYCGSSKKISFICPICGKEHESLAQSLMKGHFCKSNIGHNNPFKKDIDSFIAEIKSVDKDIIILGKYVNANTPIDVICSCGNIFKKQPAQLLLGHTKCPECASGKILWGKCKDILNKIAPKMVLISDFKNEQYISQRTSIDYICECGEKDKKSIKFLLLNPKCNKCSSVDSGKRRRKTHQEYVSEVLVKNPNIKILSQYNGNDKPITFQCSCGNIDVKNEARALIRRVITCKKCSSVIQKTTDQFIQEMKNVNPNIHIIGEYINAETPIKYVCECGNIHFSSPSSLLLGHRCGHCNMSKSEYITSYYLEKNKIDYRFDHKFDDCVNKKQLKFDFYLPNYNICIELDGEHHFMPVKFKGINDQTAMDRHLYTKQMDEIKNQYCKNNDIGLIRIPYWDFNRINEILDVVFINQYQLDYQDNNSQFKEVK